MENQYKKDSFIHFGKVVKEWNQIYGEPDFSKVYPANLKRLQVCLGIIENLKPRKILDVGCGTGEAILELLRRGYDVKGFDLAPEMVKDTREKLKNKKYDEDIAWVDNMDNPSKIKNNEFDCIIGLGVYPYSRTFEKTMAKSFELLPSKGNIIFSLRNELFSLFSLNEFTSEFYKKILPEQNGIDEKFKTEVSDYYKAKFFESFQKSFKTIDDHNVFCPYHNPLEIEDKLLKKNNMKLKKIYWYHFHIAPPKFEHKYSVEFRKKSWEMEDPYDWRGLFLCSTFIVHAEKI